jgi:hypothetical protein
VTNGRLRVLRSAHRVLPRLREQYMCPSSGASLHLTLSQCRHHLFKRIFGPPGLTPCADDREKRRFVRSSAGAQRTGA